MRSTRTGAVLLALICGCSSDTSSRDFVEIDGDDGTSATIDAAGLEVDTGGACGDDDTACDDGDPCTVDDRCSGGVCIGGSSLICDDPDSCTIAQCKHGVGCVFTSLLDGDSCTLNCYGTATCEGGVCTPDPSSAAHCPDSSEPCVARYGCDAKTGDCTVPIFRPAGTACNLDDDVCTLERCDGEGTCAATGGIDDCTTENQNNRCWSYVCVKKTGCTKTLFLAGGSCDDHNGCTSSDTCGLTPAGQQTCLGELLPIDDHNLCTDDKCEGGVITHQAVDGVVCAVSGNACAQGLCANGTCEPQALVNCDDHNPCTSDSCDPATGQCVHGAPTPCQHGGTCYDEASVPSVCLCPAGYTGTLCELDVDECTSGLAICDPNATCTDTDGGYTCACKAGYSGDGFACGDTDGCAAAPCADGVTCIDVPAPGSGRTCGPCPGGRWGDGATCTPCMAVAMCTATVSCTTATDSACSQCSSGYAQDAAGEPCTDRDECAAGNGGCDPLTLCTNTAGSRSCGPCPSGYTGDGYVECTDIDECATDNGGCGTVSAWACTNTAGSFNCADKDECALGTDDCDPHASCANTVGAFTCTCKTGYSGDGTSCVDTDGCAAAPCADSVTCSDAPAPETGRTCGTCPAGQWGDGGSCTPCTPLASCDGEIACTSAGDSVCPTCATGYVQLTVGADCTDLDECATDNGGCDMLTPCTNTPGSRTCGACPNGYSGDGETGCTDIDECAADIDGCATAHTCTNTEGSFTCTDCPSGYWNAPADGVEICVKLEAASVQIAAGAYHTCALLDDGTVKCWGFNDHGELGLGNTANRGDGPDEMGVALPMVDLGFGVTVVALAVDRYHSCALLDGGQVKCWGYNGFGELGLGDTTNRGDGSGAMGGALPLVQLGQTAMGLGAGHYHTCVMLDGGTVKCWGNNSAGQLGLGDTVRRGNEPGEMGAALPVVNLGSGRTASAVAGGGSHACMVLDSGQVKCWGYNNAGQLGLGDTENRGDGPGEMGDALAAVDLGTSRTAVGITAGYFHTCALLDDGSVKCWGANNGQLGLGDGTDRGDGPGEMGDALSAVDLGTGRIAVAVIAGYFHTCALLDDGEVKCWGDNRNGQLGLGDTVSRGRDEGEMGDDLPPVELGAGRTAVAITAGYFHTCALLDDSTVKCWGANTFGQLGLGDVDDRGDQADEMGDALPVVPLR